MYTYKFGYNKTTYGYGYSEFKTTYNIIGSIKNYYDVHYGDDDSIFDRPIYYRKAKYLYLTSTPEKFATNTRDLGPNLWHPLGVWVSYPFIGTYSIGTPHLSKFDYNFVAGYNGVSATYSNVCIKIDAYITNGTGFDFIGSAQVSNITSTLASYHVEYSVAGTVILEHECEAHFKVYAGRF